MVKRRQLTRELVIARAVAMADTEGDVSAISITKLARALEVQPPSLYNHVTSLEDLRLGMAAVALQELIIALRQVTFSLVGRDAILAMAHTYRQFARSHPGVYPLIMRAPEPHETEMVALSQELLQMMLLVMASLGLQREDAYHAIRGLRAVLHGFVSLEAAEGYKMALDREESFHRLISAYLHGMSRMEAPAPAEEGGSPYPGS